MVNRANVFDDVKKCEVYSFIKNNTFVKMYSLLFER